MVVSTQLESTEPDMLSPEERRLILGILALLAFGACVRACRGKVTETTIPRVELPSAQDAGPLPPKRSGD